MRASGYDWLRLKEEARKREQLAKSIENYGRVNYLEWNY